MAQRSDALGCVVGDSDKARSAREVCTTVGRSLPISRHRIGKRTLPGTEGSGGPRRRPNTEAVQATTSTADFQEFSGRVNGPCANPATSQHAIKIEGVSKVDPAIGTRRPANFLLLLQPYIAVNREESPSPVFA